MERLQADAYSAGARGVRRGRLEGSNQMIHDRPPFDKMSAEEHAKSIYEQTLIVKVAPARSRTWTRRPSQ